MKEMKKKIIGMATALALMGMTGTAQAELTEIGTATYNGSEHKLFLDDNNNGKSLVWFDYVDSNTHNWSYQMSWAAGLDSVLTINLYNGYNITWTDPEWRLPSAGTNPVKGDNNTSSELGHVYYEENRYLLKATNTSQLLYTGTQYWYNTDYIWRFSSHNGYESYVINTTDHHAVAVRTAQVFCDDDNLCTSDSLVPGTGCVFTPITCATDLDACTNEFCDPAIGCTMTQVTCDDNDACTSDTCDSGSGCIYTDISCDDSNVCTTDTCDSGSGCLNTPVAAGTDCSDGTFCNGLETCDAAGSCQSGTSECGDDGLYCTGSESCDEVNDTCLSSGDPCAATHSCNETADNCDKIPVCGDGILDAGETCDDGNVIDGDCCAANCTLESEGSPCADVSFCNGVGACDATGACQGQTVDCPLALTCYGFEHPADQSPVIVKKNRALPLKAILKDSEGFEITDIDLNALPVIQVLYSPDYDTEPVDVTEFAVNANQSTEGNQFVYLGSQWQYILKIKNYSAAGIYSITMESADLSEYDIETCSVSFVIK